MDSHQPSISVYERRWFDELERIAADVGITRTSSGELKPDTRARKGIAAKADRLAHQLALLRPQMDVLAGLLPTSAPCWVPTSCARSKICWQPKQPCWPKPRQRSPISVQEWRKTRRASRASQSTRICRLPASTRARRGYRRVCRTAARSPTSLLPLPFARARHLRSSLSNPPSHHLNPTSYSAETFLCSCGQWDVLRKKNRGIE